MPNAPADRAAEAASLAALHRRLGARVAPYRGVEAPASYGEPEAEYRAMRRSCGLLERGWACLLELAGEDRHRFLNGLVTCDVKGLAAGGAVYGFFTSVKGHVLADVTVLALDDRLWLELPRENAAEIEAHLRKYVVADRVEIGPLGRVPLTLIGPGAAAVAGDGSPREVWHHTSVRIAGHEVRAVREPELGAPVWSFWTAAEAAAMVFEELLRRGAAAGIRPVGHEAFDVLRVEEGRPLFGRDYGPDNLPQETGLEAVSYSKGCYLGQEVVARIHYRGGVQRALRGLLFPPGAAAAVGRGVSCDGREVGAVTSAVASPRLGRPIGLAILHRRAEPGRRLEIAGGGEAEVVELPFPAADRVDSPPSS